MDERGEGGGHLVDPGEGAGAPAQPRGGCAGVVGGGARSVVPRGLFSEASTWKRGVGVSGWLCSRLGMFLKMKILC